MAKYQEWLTEDGLKVIESWARDGLTDKQIAANIGVAERTFTDWKKNYNAISASLKKGKMPVDFEVENALLKRALGFEYEEEEMYVDVASDGTKKQKKKKVKKYAVPDTTAQIFWLKNRKPEWRAQYGGKVNDDLTKVKIEKIKEEIKLIKGKEPDTTLMKLLIDAASGGKDE